ncbi:radical SAM protein [Ruminococcus flavefaciens]|uniref:Radical SAM family protein n=1 Tax=Ruminococcus flavefaciens TaxID=1265 RepID=A0A315Y2I8_RUMFL|nr:radical SAM protein [Ruminococcus flavefaciens]PWJ14697.1 radical SAM family protein [Ruminococcus flavefaciens]SSA42727.1 Radical SAM superfamily protein [Ruminococcus flavefaciens]
MDKIKRFIECLLPITACNLKCSYCYVIQRDNRTNKMAEMKYTPEQIGLATKKDRWGGCCYFSICGAGETTIQKNIDEIAYNILKNGHYVNITTNGTVTKQLEKILSTCKEYVTHLHFCFSFHYIELMNHNLVDVFFKNFRLIKNSGASIMIQFNMCDEYLPYLNEMKDLCIRETGAAPQIAATREEEKNLEKIKLLTNYTKEEYIGFGKPFDSPLFYYTMKNFNVKRKEFCYAGDWAMNLNLGTGVMRRCYCSYIRQDVFKKPSEKIRFLAIGHACGSPFCMNSSHFMSLGVIPEVESPSYAALRNRNEGEWYSDEMNEFLSSKLYDSNEEYSFPKKILCDCVGIADTFVRKTYSIYRKIKG